MHGDAETFCRGLELGRVCDEDPRPALETFASCLESIRTGNKPVVGLVQGAAAAGGVGLAAACDAVLATTEATFTLTELLFGLTPAIIFPYLAQRLSPQKLRWIVLSAQTLTAHEALHAGLADFVCPSEKAPIVLRSWVRRLQRVEPNAVGIWKRIAAEPNAVSSRQGVQMTLARLCDPEVRTAFLEFSETGILPLRGGAS
jgi:enoyl-CoA hydratase/carnithine racemase